MRSHSLESIPVNMKDIKDDQSKEARTPCFGPSHRTAVRSLISVARARTWSEELPLVPVRNTDQCLIGNLSSKTNL